MPHNKQLLLWRATNAMLLLLLLLAQELNLGSDVISTPDNYKAYDGEESDLDKL
jgi:hypothetical protein